MKILILFCVLAVIEYSVQFTFDQKPLDILTLRVTWPKTKCLDPGKNTCTIDSKVTSWGIHGLWPNYNGGSWPEYCNKSNKFDSNQVKNLLNDLNVLWPNLYSNSDVYSFWKHEWEKHGTCALPMNQIKSQYDYFKVSLDLTRKYNFGNILKRSGIVPSEIKTYSFSEISDAIESELKYPPYISCYKATDNKQYIYELGICFDLDFQLIPCQSRQSSSCYKTLPIKYPTIH